MKPITCSLSLVALLALTGPGPAVAGGCSSSKAHAKATKASWATPARPDIVDTAAAAGSFNTLIAAVKAADLVDTLRGEGPFTVFAPTDEAFAKLPKGTVEGLLADPEALRSVLTYHVVPGELKAEEIADRRRARTVQGSRVTFADQGWSVNGATIVKSDIRAANGVIHVIDTVILPPERVGG